MQPAKPSRFPDSLVLIFGMIAAALVATWLLPAGEFERDGRTVIAGTYHAVEASRLAPWALLTSIPRGLEAAADIIFFVFIVGGVIGVVRATGANDAMIGAAIARLGGRPLLLVAGRVTLLAVGYTTIGMAEEYMPFIPILVTMCIALRMDAIVAMGIVYVGAGVGYGCAASNPFTVMIAQRIAGIEPLGSGQAFRWLLLLVCLVIGVHHIMRYAARLRVDPARSLVADVDYTRGFDLPKDVRLTAGRGLVIAVFVLGIVLFVWGVRTWEWYLTELAAVFLAIALASAVAARLGVNRTAREFCSGAAELTTTALLIGFARTIEVVLSDGKVIDTVVHGIAQTLDGLGPHAAALGMLGVQSVCNLFIPSGSGQAYVTMPIMSPLAALTGVTQQTAVLAYQIGDGFTNMIVPTNALLMGMLALGRIPYQRWLRFVVPLLVKLFVAAAIALMIAVSIDFGG
jgi:uncharacterized ion transporter superfamily protein YfcC